MKIKLSKEKFRLMGDALIKLGVLKDVQEKENGFVVEFQNLKDLDEQRSTIIMNMLSAPEIQTIYLLQQVYGKQEADFERDLDGNGVPDGIDAKSKQVTTEKVRVADLDSYNPAALARNWFVGKEKEEERVVER